jgi:SpoIID/LytB domain protein
MPRTCRSVFAALAVALTVLALSPIPPAAAAASDYVTFEGHGWGHGRGMGQWGALGYALSGTSWTDILAHYYPNTHDGGFDDGRVINVELSRMNNIDSIVIDPSGANAGTTATGAAKSAAWLVHRTAANVFTISTGPGCGGPWAAVKTGVAGPIHLFSTVDQDGVSPKLQTCEAAGNHTYRGDLIAFDNGGARTANAPLMTWYLRGVVPSESPASWGSLGSGAGENELRAQAVAARSYAAGYVRNALPDLDDTTTYQYYLGAGAEAAQSNQAVADTAGHVRLMPDNSLARTEFSSSTGGQTAGGTFPSVVDDGDSVCVTGACNPNHDWKVQIPVSAIQSAYPQIGTYLGMAVTQRTAADGGLRAQTVVVRGTNGSVTVSGSSLQSALGLKSTWFYPVGSPSGGVNGYWVLGSDGGIFTFGAAQFYGSTGGKPLNKPIVGMAATKSGKGYWLVASDGGIFNYGDAGFFGSMGGKPLNKPIVGMARTPSGNGYWLVASDGGIFSFGDAAGRFFGSMGGKPLNKPMVGMAATSTGNGYWTVASDGGIFAYGDAVFRGSTGGQPLNKPIIGMAAKSDDSGYWLSASDGGLFAYNAPFYGSLPGRGINATATGMRPTFTGGGYLIVTSAGDVVSFGDAPVMGNVKDVVPGWTGEAQGLDVSPGS